jgi:YHYH protein
MRRDWRHSMFPVLFVGALLTGCGGGGGGSGTSTSTVVTIPVTVPGAPTIGAATPGSGSATVAFTAPASNGGSAISGYTLTCTAAGTSKTATGAASPLTVSGLANGVAQSCTVTATNSAGTSPASSSVVVTPVAASVDPTKVPLGDGHLSTTTPQVGYVFACTIPSSSNPPGKSPWISADGTTWDSTAKISVQGVVNWISILTVQLTGSARQVNGNGLPSHPTGTFPIAASDPARAYDGNPNSISSVVIAWGLPASPVVASSPSCTSLGAIGVLLSGARLFNALDADGRDAVAHEVQDSCQGHPQGASIYHYHNMTQCLSATDTVGQHSALIGYIADGFGLYGNQGEGGVKLTNADLDVCHGHTHAVMIGGVSTIQYHYHATKEYPYTVGCYRGTPVTIH